jgi:excisionase family DNA binding protein
MDTTPRDWYTVQQIAALLDVNSETVRRWIRAGVLPATSFGSTKKAGYRVARADLVAFLRQRYGTQGNEKAAA